MTRHGVALIFTASLLSTFTLAEPAHAFFGLSDPLGGAATGALIGGIAGGGSGAAIGAFSGALVGAAVQDERRRRYRDDYYRDRDYDRRDR
jgi:hypothetical protein